MKAKKQCRSKYSEHFERVEASPEKMAEAIMKSPARKMAGHIKLICDALR